MWSARHEAAETEARLRELCATLGYERAGLTSAAVQLDDSSSDALVQLQTELLRAERIAQRTGGAPPAAGPAAAAPPLGEARGNAARSDAPVDVSKLSLLKSKSKVSRAAAPSAAPAAAPSAAPAARPLAVGDTCQAQFDNGEWYNARCTGKSAAGVTVEFVDDGVVLRDVPPQRLRPRPQ